MDEYTIVGRSVEKNNDGTFAEITVDTSEGDRYFFYLEKVDGEWEVLDPDDL